MTSNSSPGEKQIKSELRRQVLRGHISNQESLVVDELGLLHAQGRIDVAVINGCVHGYEIKSASDTLKRLPRQLEIYCQCLHKLTLVIDTHHLIACEKQLPEWCGIFEAVRGPRGGMRFRRIRIAQWNPHLDPFTLAHLLWRDEACQALLNLGVNKQHLKRPRKDLYQMLVNQISISELTKLIKQSMIQRQNWRALERSR